MSDHPVKPTDKAYEKARSLWRDARGVTEGIREVTDYGFREGADRELEQHGALDCNIDHIREALEKLDD